MTFKEHQTKNDKYFQEVLRNELAQRIIDLDFYGARDAEYTPDMVADDIRNIPLAVIEYLVDMCEDLQS